MRLPPQSRVAPWKRVGRSGYLRAAADAGRQMQKPRHSQKGEAGGKTGGFSGVQPWYPPTPSNLASSLAAILSPPPPPTTTDDSGSLCNGEGLATGCGKKVPRVEYRGPPGRSCLSRALLNPKGTCGPPPVSPLHVVAISWGMSPGTPRPPDSRPSAFRPSALARGRGWNG